MSSSYHLLLGLYPVSPPLLTPVLLDGDVAHDEKDIQEGDVARRQGVFHIDYDVWEDVVATWDIKSSLIPHRSMDEGTQVGVNGWYG